MRSGDLIRLGVLAGTNGRSDGVGWPSADDLTSHYAEHWPAPPLAVALAEDLGVTLANMAGAHTVNADVVVSLCRVGAQEFANRTHARILLTDSDDPADNPNLDTVLADLADAIIAWRDDGKSVLIHCVQAERRTPAVAAAYLARQQGLSSAETWEQVTTVLPGARVNPAFAASLARLWP